MIEQAKFIYSPLGKAFEKQTKTIEEQGKNKIDGIANQSKRLAALTNKDDNHEDNYKEIFEELPEERFGEIKELINKINQNDLIYYFRGNTARKRFDDFTNGIKLFEKIKPGKMKLEEAKKPLQNVFKSNLNEISRGWHKSKEQKSPLENIKLLCKSREAAIKVFNNYSPIVSEAKYRSIYAKGRKILTPKKCFKDYQ